MVLALVGSGLWWGLSDGEDSSRTPSSVAGIASSGDRVPVTDIALPRSARVLNAPETSWSVTAESLGAGGFASNSGFPGDELTVVGTIAVVRSTEDRLFGLDTTTGEVRWQRDTTQSTWCVGVEEVLLCEEDGLRRLDPASGEVLAQTPAVPGATSFRMWNGNLLAVSPAASGDRWDLTVSLRDPDTLAQRWSTDLRTSSGDEVEGEGNIPLQLDGQVANIAWGPSGWRVDLATRQVTEFPDASWQFAQEAAAGYSTVSDEDGTDVQDFQGNTLLHLDGQPWPSSGIGSIGTGRVGAGATMYDVASGAELWRTDSFDSDALAWLTPDLVAGQWEDSHQVLDARTGDPLFAEPGGVSHAITTPSAIITTGDHVLRVRDRSGAEQWRRDLSSPEAGLFVSDRAILTSDPAVVQGHSSFMPGGSHGGTRYVTACGSEPTLTPVSAAPSSGGVLVTFDVSASCPDGQWLNAYRYAVDLEGGDGAASLLARGTFDFGTFPLWIGPQGRQLGLVFPTSGTYAASDQINQGAVDRTIMVNCSRDPAGGEAPVPEGTEDGSSPDEVRHAGESPVLPDPGGTDSSAAGDEEENALAALRRIAAADKPGLVSSVEGLWVPQLSSKKQGTVDDGISYRYRDILDEHLRLRNRYPHARLAFSTEWGAFLAQGYWVTLVVEPTAEPDPALAWCDEQYFSATHCYAKRLVEHGDAEGNTRHRS